MDIAKSTIENPNLR